MNIISLMEYPDRLCGGGGDGGGGGGGGILLCLLSTCILILIAGNEGGVRSVIGGVCGREAIDAEYML